MAYGRSYKEVARSTADAPNVSHHPGGRMSSESDDTQVVEDFAASAAQFCELVDDYARYTVPGFVRALEPALAKLIYHASLLTLAEHGRWRTPEKVGSVDDEWAQREALDAFTGESGWYWFVFDPADRDDHEVVRFSLGSDLSEIYRELKFRRMRGLGGAIRPVVVWTWRLNFETSWGVHAANALQVVHSLLAWHDMSEDD